MEWIQQPILKLRIWIGFFSTLCKILTCNVIFQSFCVFDLTIFSISNSTSSSVSSWYFDPPNFLFWSLSNVFPAKAFFNASRSKSYSVFGSECFLQIKKIERVFQHFHNQKLNWLKIWNSTLNIQIFDSAKMGHICRSSRSGIEVVYTAAAIFRQIDQISGISKLL